MISVGTCNEAEDTVKKFSSLAVFCGASIGRRKEFSEAVEQLGKEMGMRNIRLVYGGTSLLMSIHECRNLR
jgi:predicted Rossmann-fold nucleotide-binding protein